MPAETLAPPAPEAAPNPATMNAAPPAPTGIDAMMAQLDKAVSSGKNINDPEPTSPAPPVEPSAKPVTPAAPKIEAKPATPVATKPPTEPEPEEADWSKAPPKWGRLYNNTEKKFKEQVRTLESKIQNLEKKPFTQAGDEAKLASYEKQLEELRGESTRYKQELVKRDYTASDEYKQQFVTKAQTIYAEAVDFTKQLRINDGADGRQATQADFDQIRALPPAARRKAATDMFGEYAADVLQYTRDIDSLSRDAKLAVDRHAETNERTATENALKAKKEAQEYEQRYQESMQGFQEHPDYGAYFKDDPEDPDGSQSFKDSYEEIEKIGRTYETLPLNERASYNALFKSMASAFPRALQKITRLNAENAAFKAELEKLRGTDPGAQAKNGVAAPTGDRKMGISEAAAMFDNMDAR